MSKPKSNKSSISALGDQHSENTSNKKLTKSSALEHIKIEDDLTYEEALKRLYLILEKLQNDEISLNDLQKQYQQGKMYLEYCKDLLSRVQVNVSELDANKL